MKLTLFRGTLQRLDSAIYHSDSSKARDFSKSLLDQLRVIEREFPQTTVHELLDHEAMFFD